MSMTTQDIPQDKARNEILTNPTAASESGYSGSMNQLNNGPAGLLFTLADQLIKISSPAPGDRKCDEQ